MGHGTHPFFIYSCMNHTIEIVNALTGAVDPLTQVAWYAVAQASS